MACKLEMVLYFSMLEKIKKNNISQHIKIIQNGTSVLMINFIGEQPHSFITILYVDVFAPVAELGGCDRDLMVGQRQRTKDFITHRKGSSQRLMWVCTSLGRFTIPSMGVTQRSYHAHAVSCVIGKPGRFTTFIVHESKSAVCPRGDITSSLKFAHCKHNLRNGPAKELSGPCIPVMPYKNIWGCSGPGADTLSHQGTVKYLGISNFLMLIFNTLLN